MPRWRVYGLLVVLVLVFYPRGAAAGPPRASVAVEAQRILESDILREQYRADLGQLLARADELVNTATSDERSWALVARARVLRLRGEFRDAQSDLRASDTGPPDTRDPLLRAYAAGERRLLQADRIADARLIINFGVDSSAASRFQPQRLLDDLNDVFVLTQQLLVPESGEPLATTRVLYIAQVFLSLIHAHALRTADQERKAGRSLGLDLLFGGSIGGKVQMLVELFEWSPHRSVKQRFARDHHQDCAHFGAALDRLYCVGDQHARSSAELLGLLANDLDISREERIIEALRLGLRDPAERELLAQLRHEFEARGELRPLARVAELEATDSFVRFALALDASSDHAAKLLADAQRLASAAGDTKLAVYASGFIALLHGLEHRRTSAREVWGTVERHASLHGDDGMLEVLGEVAAALARIQVQVRSDLAASDILFELSLRLHALRADRAGYVLTAASQSLMYYRGNAPHKAEEALTLALDKVAEIARDTDSSVADRLVPLELAHVMLVAEDEISVEQLLQLYILLEGLYPLRPATENFEELYYVDIASRSADEMLTREVMINHEALAEIAMESAREIISSAGPSTARWWELRASLESSLTQIYANMSWYADAVLEIADHHAEIAVQDATRMLYAELTYRKAQQDLLNNPDLLRQDFHAEARDLEWRLVYQPVLLANIRRARGDLAGARAALLDVAWMWKQVLAGEPSPQQIALLRTYFAMSVELGAHDVAGEHLAALLEHGGSDWCLDTHVDWRALGAWIRWTAAHHGVAQAWPLVERLERELGLVRGGLEPRLRLGALNQRSLGQAVAAAIDVALELGHHERATGLVASAQPSIFSTLPRSGNSELVDIATMYDMLSSKSRSPQCRADPSCVAELEHKLRELESRYEALLPADARTRETLPRAFTLRLPADTAVMTWLLGDHDLRLLVWRSDRPLQVVTREVEYLRLRGRTQRLGASLGRGVAIPSVEVDLQELASALLPTPAMLEGIDHLVLIPSDIVADVPFTLLPWAGSYLGQNFVLSEAPSLDAVAMLDTTRRAWIGKAKVLYDPVLVGAVAEADLVAPVVRGRTEPATKHALVQALAKYDLVHVIAHGRATSKGQPSALLLGAEPFSTEDVLLLDEVRARRVVLSACEVGAARGSLDNDGFRIGTALLRRGVEEVVVPLWRMEDSMQTAEFWRLFYRELRRRRSMSEALSHAQRKAAANGLPRWVWGGYKVIASPPRAAAR